MDLNKYHQPSPDIKEGIPRKIEGDKEMFLAKTRVMSHLPERADSVLDIGPACGWETKYLVEKYDGSHVTAVTLFEEEVVEIKKNSGVTAVVADMHELPFKNNRYDLVFASHVLEHSPAPYIALSEMYRVLADKGWCFLVLPSADGYTRVDNATGSANRIGNFPAHVFCSSIETLIEMGRHVGFRFLAYHEVPQIFHGKLRYQNRIFIFRKEA